MTVTIDAEPAAAVVFDAIVVGAGAAGCFAAKELTEAGLSVLLLDAGRGLDLARDFPVPPPRSFGLLDRVVLAASGQSIQARCLACTRSLRRFYVTDRENPYRSAPGKPFNWFRGRQVGGRLHTWGRVAPRFSDWELQPSTRSMKGVDWPLSYDELAPFYSNVERFLGVHGVCEGLPQLPDGEFIAARPLTGLEEHVRNEVIRRWPTRRFRSAPVVRHNPLRVPLPLLAAMETGKLTLRANAVVKRIHLDAPGARAAGVDFIDRMTTKPVRTRARVVVLCASAIESVRILLNSATSQHPDGVGNSSGLLGRFLMDHCMVAVGGDVPATLPPLDESRNADAVGDPYDLASLYLYMPGFRNITEPVEAPFHGSFSILGSVGRSGRRFLLLGFGDMAPSPDNRVRIDSRHHDAWGIPIPTLECTHSANDRALIRDMIETMREIAAAAGLRVRSAVGKPTGLVRRTLHHTVLKSVLTRDNAFHPGAAIHEMGGARMGADRRSSVVNRFNQCWDVPNVFITDGACFVSSGHQAHTLTIMALTVRACEYIVAQDRAGAL
jgi:choline dehydrogenase-like flavoprotein